MHHLHGEQPSVSTPLSILLLGKLKSLGFLKEWNCQKKGRNVNNSQNIEDLKNRNWITIHTTLQKLEAFFLFNFPKLMSRKETKI